MCSTLTRLAMQHCHKFVPSGRIHYVSSNTSNSELTHGYNTALWAMERQGSVSENKVNFQIALQNVRLDTWSGIYQSLHTAFPQRLEFALFSICGFLCFGSAYYHVLYTFTCPWTYELHFTTATDLCRIPLTPGLMWRKLQYIPYIAHCVYLLPARKDSGWVFWHTHNPYKDSQNSCFQNSWKDIQCCLQNPFQDFYYPSQYPCQDFQCQNVLQAKWYLTAALKKDWCCLFASCSALCKTAILHYWLPLLLVTWIDLTTFFPAVCP